MDSSTKNITYSKAGATLTCPVCGDSDTYQIGKLDRQKWAVYRGKYCCDTCRAYPAHTPSFGKLGTTQSESDDIDSLMDLI